MESNGPASEGRAAHVSGVLGSLITPFQFGECLGVPGRGLLRPGNLEGKSFGENSTPN